MSNASTPSPTPSPKPKLHGDAGVQQLLFGDKLLYELRQGWVTLPNRTLFALAMGGLRVRLMRSMVTTLSIVFAIAFLTYTGLTNQLVFNLAGAVRLLENSEGVPAQEVAKAVVAIRQADPIAGLPVEQRRSLAVAMGMDDATASRAELAKFDMQLGRSEFEVKSANDKLKKLQDDPKTIVEDLAAARRNVEKAKAVFADTKQKRDAADARVKLANWINAPSSAPAADTALPQLLETALRTRTTQLLDIASAPGRATDDDLADLRAMVTAFDKAQPVATATFSRVLVKEDLKRSAARLQTMLRRAGVNVATTLKGDPLDTWLIIMAMLTCAVGIANAMLMSVTERFREIGTMKCLGAQDSLVIKLFLLESMFLGLAGAIAGIVIGSLVALVAGLLQYNTYGVTAFPVVGGIKVLALSALAGMTLAVVGATYPAWAASRMKPVDALRVDE